MKCMDVSEMLRVCMTCQRVAQGGTEKWRYQKHPGEAKAHPGASHGFCGDECIEKMYPPEKGE